MAPGSAWLRLLSWVTLVVLLGACSARNPAFRLGVTDGGGASGDADPDTGTDTEAPDDAGSEPPAGDAGSEPPAGDAAAEPPAGDAGAEPPAQDAEGEARADTAEETGPPSYGPPPGCGTQVANVSAILNATAVVIDTDGTLYYTHRIGMHGYVGRVRPGAAPDPDWRTVYQSPTLTGLALDGRLRRLYVLITDGSGAIIFYRDIDTTAGGEQLWVGVANGDDLAVGGDGTVYWTERGDRHIHSLPPEGGGAPVQVTSVPLGNSALGQAPAALTIAPGGELLVGLERGGPLFSIELASGREARRTPVGELDGWMKAFTHDRRGRLYIAFHDDTAPQPVLRIEAGGTPSAPYATGRFSSIAFGRGALDCRDLYVADPAGPMQRLRVPDSF